LTTTQLQLLLAFHGHLTPSDVDGIPGPRTRAAIAAFQQSRDLTPDGVPGPATEAALRRAVADSQPEEDFWSTIRHFSREEFRCRCGGKHCDGFPAEPDHTLVRLADDIRHDLGAPAIPSSGLRCKTHNAAAGGVANSRHLCGKALDFMVQGVDGNTLLRRAQADPRTRYAYRIDSGPYIHMDVH